MELLEFLKIIFLSGDSPWEWPCVKLAAAVGGGVAAHFVHNERLLRRGELPVPFLWRGFWFTIVSAFGGLSLIRPSDAQAAFCAGLVGWFAVISFMHQQKNGGGSELAYTAQALNQDQIQRKQRDEN